MKPNFLHWCCTLLATATLLVPSPAQASDSQSACALPGQTGWTDEGHDTAYGQFRRPAGVVRAVVIYVDFPDAVATETPERDWFDPGWFAEASHGRMRLDLAFSTAWHRMPARSDSYGFDRGISYEQHEKYVGDAVAAADSEVDFSRYEIVYVMPPRSAAAIKFSPTYLFDPAAAGVTADGARVRWGVTLGQDMWRWGPKLLAHETDHIFGLPDLYSFTGQQHQYVGGWDLMGWIAGRGPTLFGWHQWKHGWLADDQVACLSHRGTLVARLSPLETAGGRKLAVIRTGPTSAYVVESRRPLGADAAICGAGALIYKVDSATGTGAGPIRVLDARPGTPAAGCHPLDDAPYGTGAVFRDAGVRIAITRSDQGGDTVVATLT